MLSTNSNMLHHLSFAVTDLARSAAIYDAAMAALGYGRVWEDATSIGYGIKPGEDIFAPKLRPADAGVPGDGLYVAFSAPSRDAVLLAPEASLGNGGTDKGARGFILNTGRTTSPPL